ncbi:MAG: hypothetical protein U5K56_05120 [Halioglobus sp.]|nr:hypothetical protein [Halioglobus sp.]
MILDEPTNGLELTQIRHMRDLIRELAEHATVIVSTHILQEVQAVGAGSDPACRWLVVDSRVDALADEGGLLVSVDGEASDVLAELGAVESLDDQGGLRRYRLGLPLTAAPQVAGKTGGQRLWRWTACSRNADAIWKQCLPT